MPIAYFDAVGGAAGDMIVGSLLDAGLPLSELERELLKLPLAGYCLSAETVDKCGLAATQFRVHTEEEEGHDHGPGGERSVTEIDGLIASSNLPDSVKRMAQNTFRRLGEAEAKVHGVPLEQVHFHEVGAVDSIVDIVGAAIGLHLLDIEQVYCSPLPLGSGTVETRHGAYPIPAPATLELLASARVPVLSSVRNLEQVTPTAAAILVTAAEFSRPPMSLEKVGYGSGEADLEIPNVLRVWIGDTAAPSVEELRVLETNIDDMNPQIYSHVLDRLFESAALDAWLTPVLMKKGRPATKVEVLCRPSEVAGLVEVLLRETSTLGVRVTIAERYAAEREVAEVSTSYGNVAIKIKRSNGRRVAAMPEFEDCKRLAEQKRVPLVDVYNAASAAARSFLSD